VSQTWTKDASRVNLKGKCILFKLEVW
jgi:hypothetical protein